MLNIITEGLVILTKIILFSASLIGIIILPFGFGDKEFKLRTKLFYIGVWIICFLISAYFIGGK